MIRDPHSIKTQFNFLYFFLQDWVVLEPGMKLIKRNSLVLWLELGTRYTGHVAVRRSVNGGLLRVCFSVTPGMAVSMREN